MSDASIARSDGPKQIPGRPTEPEQRRILVIASAGTFLMLVTFVTPLATGIRTAAALGTGVEGHAWLLSSMSVGLATTLLGAGVLADDHGQARVFNYGMVTVAVGAVIAAAAGSTGVFIGGRLVEGVGAAAVIASALGLIGAAFPAGSARARAAGVWGASVGAGTGVGGLITVALDHGQGWRTTYAVTAVLAFSLGVVARFLLTNVGARVKRHLDVPGIALLTAGLSAVLTGLVLSRSDGSHLPVVVLLALGALALGAFVLVEQRSTVPLIDLGLFAIPGFTAATLAAAVTGAATIGSMSVLPTVLQRGVGATLLMATLCVFIWAAASTLAALGLRWLPALSGSRLLIVALVVSALGLAALGVLEAGASSVRLVPGLVVLGVGYGVANAALGREAVAHVPTQHTGMGSGANNTARYMGAAVGVTVVVLLAGGGQPPGTSEGLLDGWNRAVYAAAGASLCGAVLVAAVARRGSSGRT